MPTSKNNNESSSPASAEKGTRPKTSTPPLGKTTEKEYRARVRSLERKVEQVESKLEQQSERAKASRDELTAAKQAHRKEVQDFKKLLAKESSKSGTLETPLKEAKDEYRKLKRKQNALELRSTETIERLTQQVQHLQSNSESTASVLEEAWSAVEQQKVRVDGADSREQTLIEENRKQCEALQRALERAEIQNQVMSRDLREIKTTQVKTLRSTAAESNLRENDLAADLTRERTEREALSIQLTEIERPLQHERTRYKALHEEQLQKTQHYQAEVLKFNRFVEDSKAELTWLRQQVSQHETQQKALAARARAREDALSAELEDIKQKFADSAGSASREEEGLENLNQVRLREVENKRRAEGLNKTLDEKSETLQTAQEQCAYLERLYEDTVNAANDNDTALRDYIVKLQARMDSGAHKFPAQEGAQGDASVAQDVPQPADGDTEQVTQLRYRSGRLGDQLDLSRDREKKLMAQLEKLTTMIGQINKPKAG